MRADEVGASPLDVRPHFIDDDEAARNLSPGAVLADRYRIVSLIGRGGMGAVYRADDMKLGQAVALKFVPPALARHGPTLDRLLSEVRIGRQVSHPNVCRVHDIVEADGQRFIAMEYIDGEDLASLLRRIGRLPAEKAIDIARGICAGLGAAHDRGVIHRDLKPANVMIDGRGRPRITDFGIAELSGDSQSSRRIAGTPEYMAPEQLTGRGTSVRSDLYSLGLILYEMFTGKRVFDGSLSEIIAQHNAGKPLTLTSDLRALDPTVERVVLACLNEDAAARPASAHAVIAALPGGDPLAAAMAAGETPSPAMVAAAGRVGDLQPWLAWSFLIISFAGLLLAAFLADKTFRSFPPEKSPEALTDRATETIARLGYGGRPADRASWFAPHDTLRMTRNNTPSWKAGGKRATPAISFWYRQSPTSMIAGTLNGAVTTLYPPETVSGMVAMNLDPRGRLLHFRAVPPARSEPIAAPQEPDWSRLFAAAEFDLAAFKATQPRWTPPFSSDRRAAWDGVDPHRGDAPIHIEAASHQGKPVWFRIFGVGTETPESFPTGTRPLLQAIIVTTYVVGVAGGIFLARRNLRRGRGDRKGAFRIAVVMFVTRLLYALFRLHHVSNPSLEYEQLAFAIGRSLFAAGFVWVLYMALEPYVRRRWPEMIIAWNRFIDGQFRDPLVGRDILIGCIAGIALTIILQLQYLSSGWTAFRAPLAIILEGWGTARQVAWLLFLFESNGLLLSFLVVFLLVLFRVVLRSTKLAVAAWMALATTPALISFEDGFAAVLLGVIAAAFAALIMIRVGLLAVVTAVAVRYVLLLIPLTLDFSAWYAERSMIALLIVTVIAIYGFRVSLAGKPMFGTAMLEEELT